MTGDARGLPARVVFRGEQKVGEAGCDFQNNDKNNSDGVTSHEVNKPNNNHRNIHRAQWSIQVQQ